MVEYPALYLNKTETCYANLIIPHIEYTYKYNVSTWLHNLMRI